MNDIPVLTEEQKDTLRILLEADGLQIARIIFRHLPHSPRELMVDTLGRGKIRIQPDGLCSVTNTRTVEVWELL